MTSDRRNAWLALNFATTIFVSAFLLFQVQPLIGKYILPWFGGSPAVWTTCMLFFQTLLFAGYAYAHFSVKWLRPRQQAGLHLILIAAAVTAIAVLGIAPSDDWKPQDSANPIGSILALLAATVGLPYLVLSSTGPLVQAWFARVFPGRIPYRLYALSNVGSLLALLSYPFVFERYYSSPEQAGFWSGGFVLYAIFGGMAALSIWMLMSGGETEDEKRSELSRSESSDSKQLLHESSATDSPVWWHRVLWLVLPAFASVTLLATTNHVTTDVSPMPFLWVLPLSLYLVTFIIAFDHPRWYQPALFAGITLLAVYLVAMINHTGLSVEVDECGTPGAAVKYARHTFEAWRGVAENKLSKSPTINVGFIAYLVVNLAAMFGICMTCHGELVRLRPHPRHLTGYFLLIAAGGAVGGLAVSLVAPQIFKTYFEFKLAMFAGYLVAIGIIVRALIQTMGTQQRATLHRAMVWLAPAIALPTLLIAGVGINDLLRYFDDTSDHTVYRVRNFFGTLSVTEHNTDDPETHYYRLMHGGIAHGLQFIDPSRRHLATTYYSTDSGVGLAIGYYRRSADQIGGVKVGAVGLGTGTLAAYIDLGDSIRFYEINQDVIDITEPGTWFTYLKDCKERGGVYDIQLGDARLTLEREKVQQQFHVLVLDAFSGDAIPVHLLTAEAFEIYLKHIATPEHGGAHGTIAVHISNRYVNLEPVVRALAEKFNLRQIEISNRKGDDEAYTSDWILLTRNEKMEQELAVFAEEPKKDPPPAVLWTDARSNLIEVLD